MIEKPLLSHFSSGHCFFHLIDFQYFGFDGQHLNCWHFFGLRSLVTHIHEDELIPEFLDLRVVVRYLVLIDFIHKPCFRHALSDAFYLGSCLFNRSPKLVSLFSVVLTSHLNNLLLFEGLESLLHRDLVPSFPNLLVKSLVRHLEVAFLSDIWIEMSCVIVLLPVFLSQCSLVRLHNLELSFQLA